MAKDEKGGKEKKKCGWRGEMDKKRKHTEKRENQENNARLVKLRAEHLRSKAEARRETSEKGDKLLIKVN